MFETTTYLYPAFLVYFCEPNQRKIIGKSHPSPSKWGVRAFFLNRELKKKTAFRALATSFPSRKPPSKQKKTPARCVTHVFDLVLCGVCSRLPQDAGSLIKALQNLSLRITPGLAMFKVVGSFACLHHAYLISISIFVLCIVIQLYML